MSIAEALRERVDWLGVPVTLLAQKMGMNDRTLRMKLEGSRGMKTSEALALANLLGMDADALRGQEAPVAD